MSKAKAKPPKPAKRSARPKRRKPAPAPPRQAEPAVAAPEEPAPDEDLDFEALWKLFPHGYDIVKTAGDSWFDPVCAQLACDFFPVHLTHIEGSLKGKPFILSPWQQAIVAALFGWIRRDEQGRIVRRFREVFLYVPRKNGKTPLAAGICDYVLLCDGEGGAQIYSAAADTEQAATLYRHSAGMIRANEDLDAMCQIYAGVNHRSIVLKEDPGSVYRVLSADANTKHGGNSHLVLIDELHAQKDRELVDTLATSLASENRSQPMIIFITTADVKGESICNEKLDYARKIAEGLIENQSFLPIIYECTDADDWTAEETWRKANPNLGISVSLQYMRDECKKAQQIPGYQNNFKRLHLNLQTDSDVVWIDVKEWDKCVEAFDPLILHGRRAFGGLDLSRTLDLTNFTLAFPPEHEDNGLHGGLTPEQIEAKLADPAYDPNWYFLQWFFVPRDNMEKRVKRDRVPYDVWEKAGHLIATPGNTIDYSFVRKVILEQARIFNIVGIGFDPYGAQLLEPQLLDDGLPLVKFRQGFLSISGPAKHFEILVHSGRLRERGNPVMRWMVSNCVIEMDAAENIKPSKKKSTERIDGIIGGVMGIGVAITGTEEGPSVYEKSPNGKAI